jgi:uncharacterized membrane protein
MTEKRPSHELERLVFFSDAVFAIAVTLLVIEVHVPVLPRGSDSAAYWRELVHLLPSLGGFVLSFLVIARFWITHHAVFSLASAFQERMLWPNIHLLMAVAFMPFATAFLTQNFGELVPTLIYNLTLIVTSALSVRVVRLATDSLKSDPSVDPAALAFLRSRGLAILFASVLALLIGLLVPMVSQMTLATTPIWLRLLRRKIGLIKA